MELVPSSSSLLHYVDSCRQEHGGFTYGGQAASLEATRFALEVFALLASAPASPGEIVGWVQSCRGPDGGYGVTPGANSDLGSTYYGVRALTLLGQEVTFAARCEEYVNSLRASDYGFRSTVVQEASDIDSTFYAIRALALLGRLHTNLKNCAEFLQSIQLKDGGFASRIGGGANVEATYCAVHIMKVLDPVYGDPRVSRWVCLHQASVGGFRNTFAEPPSSPATYWAVHTLQLLNAIGFNRDACNRWLSGCRTSAGGFARAPESGVADLWATYASVAALKLLLESWVKS